MKLKYFLSTFCSIIVLNTGMTAYAASKESTRLPFEGTTIAQAKPDSTEAHFNRARQLLPDNYYVLYRIIERIARSNQLDDLPWRLYISPEYNVNAFAADVNLVAFFSGLLDRVHGDPDAIACVVGHEMAHHTQNHIAMGTAEREQTLAQLRAEAFEEVAAEEEDLREDLEGLVVGEQVAEGAGSIVGSAVGGTEGALIQIGGGLLSSVLGGSKEKRLQEAAERINAIYAEKEAQLLQEWQTLSHTQEFEADELGYIYMTRAGFNPQGCQTVMTVLSRLGVTESETHPAIPDRMSAIDGFAAKYPKAALAAEGNSNLAASPVPLTYELSLDNASLRINSRTGSRDIDDLLPQ
jgi:beta-barrel assembly-enhancing protease